MRILFALPGLYRTNRGAEVAFISVAKALAELGESVTLVGSGMPAEEIPYRFLRARSVPREFFESFPSIPLLRNDCTYEELTFLPSLLARYRASEYDVTVTCSYPFTNWALRLPAPLTSRPPHVFVTQNGDWPALAKNSEYRFFGCDGLICTNPDFYDRQVARWHCALIPNGVDVARFYPGPAESVGFHLPRNRPIVLMVSALIDSKRVAAGIEAMSRIREAHLIVAGDGPLRNEIDALAAKLLPGRFSRVSVSSARMPDLYRSSNVFLHLAKEEAFGNVFLEAMACGLPIVGHDSPRLRWIVGEQEYLSDSEDIDSIARSVKAALGSCDKQKQERVKRATEFAWSTIALQYRSFLREVTLAKESLRN